MVKKDNKLQKFLKSVGLISGSGGIAGIILAISGICLPCVLVPLGFVGAGLLFLFSFISDFRWWFLGISAVFLSSALFFKRRTVCKDGVCQINSSQKNKFNFSFSGLKTNLIKLNNWKTYVAIPVVLLFGALFFTLYLSTEKSGELDTDKEIITQSDSYAKLIGSSPTKGPKDAKVTIIEYSDYFCPGCLPFYEDILEPIIEKYEDKIQFASVQVNVLMDLGYSSVHAAYCADEQDKYWEMHSKLIERVRPFVGREKNWDLGKDMMKLSGEGTPEYFTKMAGTIKGVDTQQFFDCMKSNKYSGRIAETTAVFQKLGFDGVPVLLINGKYFTGYPTQENLIKAIDEEFKS